MKEKIEKVLEKTLKNIGITNPNIKIDHPDDFSHGDFSTNVAMMYAKELKVDPKSLAHNIVNLLTQEKLEEIVSISVALPGFINFKIADSYFFKSICEIDDGFGKSHENKGKQIMVEYTDPNPFKIFHIGHLMANTIGEAISRIIEFSGAKVIRANYYGDVGLHVAKTLWAILKHKDQFPIETTDLVHRVEFLGKMYVFGSNKYEEGFKDEIVSINKKVFDKSDKEINHFYDLGRAWSLEYFETIYKKLGTKFDEYFPESDVAQSGIEIVREFLQKGVFEESQGAVVFPGDKHGLHTRVFINSEGLPTYEAKELGLTKKKFDLYPKLSQSVVITANEQSEYFRVLIKTIEFVYPDIALKMKHLSHGLLRPITGKMSSRKGNIVGADELLKEFQTLVVEKIKDRDWSEKDKNAISEIISVAALKYVVLRQAIGGDIVYDPHKTVSFEGDSGPYLQYASVRASTVIKKAKEAGISTKVKTYPAKVDVLEKMLVRFPEIVERSCKEYAPHHIVTYLTELSSFFNSYYAVNKIIDKEDSLSPYRVMLTKAFVSVMNNGFWILGIKVPEKM